MKTQCRAERKRALILRASNEMMTTMNGRNRKGGQCPLSIYGLQIPAVAAFDELRRINNKP